MPRIQPDILVFAIYLVAVGTVGALASRRQAPAERLARAFETTEAD